MCAKTHVYLHVYTSKLFSVCDPLSVRTDTTPHTHTLKPHQIAHLRCIVWVKRPCRDETPPSYVFFHVVFETRSNLCFTCFCIISLRLQKYTPVITKRRCSGLPPEYTLARAHRLVVDARCPRIVPFAAVYRVNTPNMRCAVHRCPFAVTLDVEHCGCCR